ncbi:MAG: hypothetical protein HY898_10865 [Deltaproteobacteria bacterium]|nr:hypothetical protein [Deltaproteobacteria bacterium]
MNAHVIVNALAGGFRKHPRWIERVRAACGTEARLHVTRSIQELRSAAEAIRGADADWVALCGGDGSHMAGATCLAEVYGDVPMPALLLAIGGNAGTVARNFNRERLDPARHVARAIQVSNERGMMPFLRRATLRVADSTGSSRVGFIFGTGLIAAFFKEFYARGGGGYPEASRMIARIFAGSFVDGQLARTVLSPMPCRLTVDGERHPSEAFTLIASAVVRDLGMHMLVTHRAGEDPARPHVVASSIGVRDCGQQFWRILAGRSLVGQGSVDACAREFSVDFPAGAGAYVLDGDLICADRVEVRGGPELKIIAV